MKILVCDVYLKGRENCDWKDGFELYYALKNLGYECDIAGKNCVIPETKIPEISKNYDLIIITENYPTYSGWTWWNWKEIKTPKLFWAIDTHLIDFTNFINDNNIDFVAFNNRNHMTKFETNSKNFWFPYGISNIHYNIENNEEKIHDIIFIGSLNSDREYYISKHNMKSFSLFGHSYVKEMQKSKICFNKSISNDLNAKNLEIIGSGTFMLSNMNDDFLKFMDFNEDIKKMLYTDELDLEVKIKYYLKNNEEREFLAKRAREYIFENHSYEKRMEYLIDTIKKL
jgi:spore maturation protein CgeB